MHNNTAKQIESLIKSGELGAARKRCLELLQDFKGSTHLAILCAQIDTLTGKPRLALDRLSPLIKKQQFLKVKERSALFSELAQAHYYLGELTTAAIYLQRILDVPKQRSLQRLRDQAQLRLAVIALEHKNYPKAEALLRKIHKNLSRGAPSELLASLKLNEAVLQQQTNHYSESIRIYKSAAKSAKAIKNRKNEATAHYNLANIYFSFGQWQLCTVNLSKALEIARATDNHFVLAYASLLESRYQFAQGAVEKSRQTCVTALRRLRTTGSHYNLVLYYEQLGRIYAALQMTRKVRFYSRRIMHSYGDHLLAYAAQAIYSGSRQETIERALALLSEDNSLDALDLRWQLQGLLAKCNRDNDNDTLANYNLSLAAKIRDEIRNLIPKGFQDSFWSHPWRITESAALDKQLALHQKAISAVVEGELYSLLREQQRLKFVSLKRLAEEEASGQVALKKHWNSSIITKNRAMMELFETIAQIKAAPVKVLIQGESGTGKELFAQAIHQSSSRRRRPMLSINCGAFSESLLEAELFGFERGSFTGANKSRAGLFETANGGTLFLDEIGSMPIPMQVKLLRVLQENEIRRVGGNRQIPVDVRIISATNDNLEERMQEGSFRRDLFYRLNTIVLQIPSLRERPEDIADLIRHFQARYGGRELVFPPETIEVLTKYPWPGNVRELSNEIERLSVMHTGVVLPSELRLHILKEDKGILLITPQEIQGLVQGGSYLKLMQNIERKVLGTILEYFDGKKQETAKQLGISRTTLYRKLNPEDETET